MKGPLTAAVGAGALLLYLFAGVPEIPLLFGAALLLFAAGNARRRWWGGMASVAPLGIPIGLLATAKASAIGVLSIFWSFLKIGSVLFGSGYVLLAFLRSEFVGPGMLTERQLVDAVAVGQVTPGPVFTTATFIGYLLVLSRATICICPPAIAAYGCGTPPGFRSSAMLHEARVLRDDGPRQPGTTRPLQTPYRRGFFG